MQRCHKWALQIGECHETRHHPASLGHRVRRAVTRRRCTRRNPTTRLAPVNRTRQPMSPPALTRRQASAPAGSPRRRPSYANPDSTGGLESGNTHVVSQYDVAGYQWCQHHTSCDHHLVSKALRPHPAGWLASRASAAVRGAFQEARHAGPNQRETFTIAPFCRRGSDTCRPRACPHRSTSANRLPLRSRGQ